MKMCVLCNCYLDETILDYIERPKLLVEIGSAHNKVTSSEQCLGKFWGIMDQDPSVSKSSWLHVDIFPIFFINLRYSIDSSKTIYNFSNSTG